ncbi:unnamed protein product [Gongylonema pulchrum]|uniref:NB-ARC domain-containing protein n=1 Tax=Gongylonema pulchrum TaxID=637853 RepID=A0A3P6Q5X6_9BILA|nr:unnamed protein product [Gongylonema pulchrum]
MRVSEFIRQYRRFADDLSPLISYFEKYGQPHLAEILSKSYVHEERPLLTDRQINFRLSVEGNVPHRLYNYVERRELIRDLEEFFNSSDCSFVRATDFTIQDDLLQIGFGLSFMDLLVVARVAWLQKFCAVVQRCSVGVFLSPFIFQFYEHVIWVRDGRTCVDELPALFSNFMVLASDAVAKAALRDKPNALVILDDVYLSESVRWFDQLNCRILATSRNQEIFQVSSTNPIYFKIPSVGFTLAETACAINSVLAADNSPAYMEQVAWIHQKTAGLPALIGIVARLTNGRIER